ncbi:MAG: Lrp/AsnC family transcriptional regulator, partial [Lachnospiraceae bacterium]|nr:Lrp/AsnC family transcriptional regulator [Lachnospiraceae bacterium]
MGALKNNELDNIDKKIISMLQENARVSLKEIAEQVYLSSPAVSVRIDNLVESGYIQGFHAVINPIKLGYHIKAFINLEVSPVDKNDFYPYIKKCKNVVECNCVTGDYSMLLEVLFPSTDELDQFI